MAKLPSPIQLFKKEYKIIGFLISLIVLSRLFFYRFIPLADPFQFQHHLDRVWLKNNLWESIYNLHAQPPLFNFILGFILKIAPSGQEQIIFSGFFLVIALAIGGATYLLLRLFSLSPRICFTVTLFYLLFPQERWLVYNIYLVVLLLIISVLFLSQFFSEKKITYFILFFISTSSIVLLRSFFNLFLWFVPISILIIWLIYKDKKLKNNIKRYVFVVILFFLITAMPYVKNYGRFGFLGSSSWAGLNLTHLTHYVSSQNLQKELEAGNITAIQLIPDFSPPQIYYDYFKIKPYTGVMVLDALLKSNGIPNYNNIIYIRASEEYKRNFLVLISEYPGAYALAVLNEIYIFMGFTPYKFFSTYPNWHVNQITPNIFVNTTLAKIDTFVIPPLFLVVFSGALIWFIRALKSLFRGGNILKSGIIIFIIFNISYVFLIANFCELGEANFMRSPIDVFIMLGFILFLKSFFKKNNFYF
ncbi:MAG: hypothetical protein UT55_C0007G0002 [Candidatus Peregrinibacteria bacterium GW2011_GWE2_39_6]|nr:MAG: hypothetical protein UT36_C0001G0132 [Candidatus Peregrinibacteria bacterium GW2011_GWF2_39_17]KKR26471.1 MAG: hypothetical protein UT55_C0007G0002 [Candidatus Peregrinibacteria bacterium GW2011_GWE2_39_6]HCW32570.1 hypothetical protein [Candidatus Peregrinibacteria bacterium]